MIDTDKYEGHTPTKEWGDIVYADGYLSIFLDDDVYATDIDRQLMAAAPELLEEVERLQQLIVDAAYQLYWNVGTIASSSHLSSKEWDEDIYAPAQAWRKQVQEILDDSEEGCPWKESEEE